MIRKLTREDAKQYKSLRLLALTTDPDAYFATFEEESRRDDWSFANEISGKLDPFGYIGWFDDSGALRAYVELSPHYYQKTKHTAELFNLYVDPAFRSRGIARELVSALLDGAKNSPLETIFLTVMSSNLPAQKLYESLGFVVFATKQNSLKTDHGYLSEILMRYDLVALSS